MKIERRRFHPSHDRIGGDRITYKTIQDAPVSPFVFTHHTNVVCLSARDSYDHPESYRVELTVDELRAALAFAERCLADHANRAKARGEG